MRMTVSDDSVRVVLSESNIKELYALMQLNNVQQDRGEVALVPTIIKETDGVVQSVSVQRDAVHYSSEQAQRLRGFQLRPAGIEYASRQVER